MSIDTDNDLDICTDIWTRSELENRPVSSHLMCLSKPAAHLQLAKILSPALGLQVQIWSLPERAYSVACTSLDIIVGSTVPHAPVVPDSQIVLPPFKADLSIVILRDQVEEVAKDHVGLVLGNAIDAFCEASVDINGFPARHSYNGTGQSCQPRL